jgi:hypothetical protein
MQNGFGIELLQTVFQDAVLVTRKLSVPYLWIDALCIVQDDEDGWGKERPRMGDYYRNAYITISALKSKNGFESFLQPRNVEDQAELTGTGV